MNNEYDKNPIYNMLQVLLLKKYKKRKEQFKTNDIFLKCILKKQNKFSKNYQNHIVELEILIDAGEN